MATTKKKKTTKRKGPGPGRPRTEATAPMAVRLPLSTVARLDRYRHALEQTLPGMTVTRAGAIARLVAIGLQREAVGEDVSGIAAAADAPKAKR